MDESLARVPFARADEQAIESMARWMRFMAVVGIVGGILMVFALVIGVGLVSAVLALGDVSPEWGKARAAMSGAEALVFLMLLAFLLAAVVSLWQNFALYHAGDYFTLVARTDEADVDNLAAGLDKLRTYFKIQVLVTVVTAAVAVGTGLAVYAVAVARPTP